MSYLSFTGARACAKANSAVCGVGEFDIGAGQVFGSWQEREILDSGGKNDLFSLGVAYQNVVDRVPIVVPGNTEPGRGIGLRIAIDEKHFQTLKGQTRGKIDGSRCLAHSTLLVHDAENLSHSVSG